MNCAALAGPPSPHGSVEAGHFDEVPATVLIVPVGDTRRIRAPSLSAIRSPPSAVATTPPGPSMNADVAGPPSPHGGWTGEQLPPPATVLIVPLEATRRIRFWSETRN